MLAWCRKHGDTETAQLAADKLDSLNERLRAPRLKPLATDDLFLSHVGVPHGIDLAEVHAPDAESIRSLKLSGIIGPGADRLAEYAAEIDGSPTRIAHEVWRDRIAAQDRVGAPHKNNSVGSQLVRFLGRKEEALQAGELSAARLNKLRLHLTHFAEWLGNSTAVTQIDGTTLEDYRADLLTRVAAKGWTRTTAADRLNDVRTFIRWLWRTEAIPNLPRNLDDKSLSIGSTSNEIVTFTMDEIHTLLKEGSDRTTLYILLMLNCGMTQKDIADLLIGEVDWEDGRIIRKRSKTKEHEKVPKVNYQLWPETLSLLRAERAAFDEGLALLNASGSAL